MDAIATAEVIDVLPLDTAPKGPLDFANSGPAIWLYRSTDEPPIEGWWQGGRKNCWTSAWGRLPFYPIGWMPKIPGGVTH